MPPSYSSNKLLAINIIMSASTMSNVHMLAIHTNSPNDADESHSQRFSPAGAAIRIFFMGAGLLCSALIIYGGNNHENCMYPVYFSLIFDIQNEWMNGRAVVKIEKLSRKRK